MLFNSFEYAVFLPIVFIIYWIFPSKCRWIFILLASYYFYMSWNIKYVFLIFFTSFISYVAAILIEKTKKVYIKKCILFGVFCICLGILFFYKYFNFVSESIASLCRLFAIQLNPIVLDLLLPVGISFYSFQTLSYVIDVYKGCVKAEHHFGYYATFISFFPQLVAGPIERTNNLLPQIKAEHKFDYERAIYGLKLMAWGYFKKIVIADSLSQFVSKIYQNPQEFSGFVFVLTMIFFSFQIYCDFSGYSDIAIGTAKLLGINLVTNFKSPYFSQSIKEFWSRWHISLSTWFKDYVYIPLGGSRVREIRHIINLIITFLISGLWHGANWTFVIWGGIHGLGQSVEQLVIPRNSLLEKEKGIKWGVRVLFVYAFTSFAWIFFASNTLEDVAYIIGHMFVGITTPVLYFHNGMLDMGISLKELVVVVVYVSILLFYDYISLKKDVLYELSKINTFCRWALYVTFVVLIVCNISVSNETAFIYFQF